MVNIKYVHFHVLDTIEQHRIFDCCDLHGNSGDAWVRRKYVGILRVDVAKFDNTIYTIMFSAWVISNRFASVKLKVLVINIWSPYSCTYEKIGPGYTPNISLAEGVSSEI